MKACEKEKQGAFVSYCRIHGAVTIAYELAVASSDWSRLMSLAVRAVPT